MNPGTTRELIEQRLQLHSTDERLGRHVTKTRLLPMIAAMVMVTMATTTTAAAAPPAEFDDPEYIVLYADVNINRSVFVNITARDFCEWLDVAEPFFEWLEGGMQGPPPLDPGPIPAIERVPVRVIENGHGVNIQADQSDLYVEIWEFDEDPSPLAGPCIDIQVQLDDPDSEPWATGTVREKLNASKSFGDKVTGTITTTADDVTYQYSTTYHINEMCNVDRATGVPNCLADHSKLTPAR